MNDKESRAGEGPDRGSPTEQAGETTAADMVSGPPDTRPVGAGTEVKVTDAPGGAEKGGSE